eukprot:1158649-Pelagomonas_calceolata.AAC.1
MSDAKIGMHAQSKTAHPSSARYAAERAEPRNDARNVAERAEPRNDAAVTILQEACDHANKHVQD